jgi:hypothetical protein
MRNARSAALSYLQLSTRVLELSAGDGMDVIEGVGEGSLKMAVIQDRTVSYRW